MSQNLGKTLLPPNVFRVVYAYAYAHIAAMSRVGIEMQKSEIETKMKVWDYETKTSKNVTQDINFCS